MSIEFHPACGEQKQQGAHLCLGGQVIHQRGCCSSIVAELFLPVFLAIPADDQPKPQSPCVPERRALLDPMCEGVLPSQMLIFHWQIRLCQTGQLLS